MITTDQQVRKLMEEMSKHGNQGIAALRAGMDRKTARKYLKAGKLPSELGTVRTWRTRADPFEVDWPYVVTMLTDAPELEAKTLFEHLAERTPGTYEEGQVRTLQRRVERWRAESGPEREVFFPQEHRPGEAMQTDFTWCTELGVTIGGEAFAHMLCHAVLPYSNWEWATVCFSESLLALRAGVQAAVFRLGRVPAYLQTDNSTAATHELEDGDREFNRDYDRMVRHLGMTPRVIGVGKKEQNGDVESSHRALKARLKQHLLLRKSRDFESVAAYEAFVQGVVEKANGLRRRRLSEELEVMSVLQVERLPEYTEEDVLVTAWSTIRVKRNTYSVPSRLIDQTVRVRVYDDRIEVYFGNVQQLVVERLLGSGGHRINYRHIIWSLVRKPGAFARYRYREDLFPTVRFRRAYDALCGDRTVAWADLEYLRILHLAASTMESEVELALELLLDGGQTPLADAVKALVAPAKPEVPELAVPPVSLAEYDELLSAVGEVLP